MDKLTDTNAMRLTPSPTLSGLLNQLPFPVAVTAERLMLELERQDPIGAILAVRDAIESAIKMIGSIVVADLQQAVDTDNPILREIVSILLNGRGISAGHWSAIIRMSLGELRPAKDPDHTAVARRYVPAFYDAFFNASGRASALSRRIDGGKDGQRPYRKSSGQSTRGR